MEKIIIFDANGVKWILQNCPCGCARVWADVEGDEMAEESFARGEHSGYIEDTLENALLALMRDGYME